MESPYDPDDDIFLYGSDDDFDFSLPATPKSNPDFGSDYESDDDDFLSLLDTDVALSRPGPSARRLKKASQKRATASKRVKKPLADDAPGDVDMSDALSGTHVRDRASSRECKYLIRSFSYYMVDPPKIKKRHRMKQSKYPLAVNYKRPLMNRSYNWPWPAYTASRFDDRQAVPVPDRDADELLPPREVRKRRNNWQQQSVEEFQASCHGPRPLPAQASEPQQPNIKPLEEEIPRMVRNVLSEARRTEHSDLLLEDSDSVRLVSAEVLERMEEVLLMSFKMRNHPRTHPALSRSAKSAGDWDTVMHAARALHMPERVIERTRLRLFAIQERLPLAKKMCFEEMPWRVPPGGRKLNRLADEPAS